MWDLKWCWLRCAGKGIKWFRKENMGKESKYWRRVKEQKWWVNKSRCEKQTGAQKETKWLFWEQGPGRKERGHQGKQTKHHRFTSYFAPESCQPLLPPPCSLLALGVTTPDPPGASLMGRTQLNCPGNIHSNICVSLPPLEDFFLISNLNLTLFQSDCASGHWCKTPSPKFSVVL